MSFFMNQPCKHCPFRKDIHPFLTESRAQELAHATENPYNSFSCHKTLEYDEDGETFVGDDAKQCAGFLTMVSNNGYKTPEGFEPAIDAVFSDKNEMIDHYKRKPRTKK